MQALFKLDQALCKHCANTNQACYLWCACSVQTMFKQCSSKLTPLLDFAWTLFAHCLYTLLEHFFRCLISAWFCLNMLDCASISSPSLCKQWSSKLDFAWFLLDFDTSSDQAVFKQWSSNEKIVKKSSRSAWFCLIMLDSAWSLLDHCLILLDYWTFCSVGTTPFLDESTLRQKQ